MKVLVLYDTMGGNTEKVAERIHQAVVAVRFDSALMKLSSDTELDFYDYDLVFVGSPDIAWLPSKKMMGFLQNKLQEHRLCGDILPCAPIRPGKFAVCFSTFCGVHTGEEEVVSVTQWMASFFGHIGYTVLENIHLAGEMRRIGQAKGWMTDEILEKMNTCGKLGDIKGRPNEEDLRVLEQRIKGLLGSLQFVSSD